MIRGDGAGLHTPEGADRKAYTARTFGRPSATFVKRLVERPDIVGSLQYTRVLALAGGRPVKSGNEAVGAVGVSGSPGKDDVFSQSIATIYRCRWRCVWTNPWRPYRVHPSRILSRTSAPRVT